MVKSLLEGASQWLSAGTEPAICSDCGGEMELTYVRAPSFQVHYRGVRALQCVECGRAELDE